jgi:hypothetical protein
MLTGKPPVPGWPAPPPSTVNRSLPKELDPIVGRLLSTNAGSRYESAAAVAAELRSLSAILDVRAKRAEPDRLEVRRPAASSRRGWILVLLAVLVAAALIWAAARL